VTIDIETIRKRAEAATEGPMELSPCRSIPDAPELFDVSSADLYVAERLFENDAELVMHARKDILGLIELIERAYTVAMTQSGKAAAAVLGEAFKK
jgi:hypothetical protein